MAHVSDCAVLSDKSCSNNMNAEGRESTGFEGDYASDIGQVWFFASE